MKKLEYRKKLKILRNIDWKLITIVLVIFFFGLLVLSSATHSNLTGNYIQIYKQLLAFLIGILIIGGLMLIDYNSIGKYYKELYLISLILLVLVLIPGIGDEQFGARSWIHIGNFNIQTSEIVKTTFILSYAYIVDKNKKNINDLKTLFILMVYAFPFIGLLLSQPDLGTAIVFSVMIFFMLYSAGIDNKIIRNVFIDRKSTRLNSSHANISYAVFCLKKKKRTS